MYAHTDIYRVNAPIHNVAAIFVFYSTISDERSKKDGDLRYYRAIASKSILILPIFCCVSLYTTEKYSRTLLTLDSN